MQVWLGSEEHWKSLFDWETPKIGGVMVSVLVLSPVDGGFKPRLGQTKDYYIGICCFFTKQY